MWYTDMFSLKKEKELGANFVSEETVSENTEDRLFRMDKQSTVMLIVPKMTHRGFNSGTL